MEKSRKYFYTYEDCEELHKSSDTMVADILEDPELPNLEEIIIGCWGWSSCQKCIDDMIANREKFSHIKSLFMGDMESEECEVSWIPQGNYEKLWEAFPQLQKLTIKGSEGLKLGTIRHDSLKELEIICGGLPVNVIESIRDAHLPQLERLMLYIGVEAYGFDGDENTIQDLLEKSDFPKLRYLGITDSEIQNELTQVVLDSKYMEQIDTLDLSYGTLDDQGGELIASKLKEHSNVKKIIINYHYLSKKGEDTLRNDLKELGVEAIIENRRKNRSYCYPMLTE